MKGTIRLLCFVLIVILYYKQIKEIRAWTLQYEI